MPLVKPPASRSPQFVARARAPAPLPAAMPASVSNRKPAISIVEMARLDRIGAVPNLNRDRRRHPLGAVFAPSNVRAGSALAAVALVVAFAITLGARLSAPPAAPSGPAPGASAYAVVFDAGSTGNRVHVFEFSAASPATTIGALANEVFRAETPGFRARAADPDAAAAMLDPLIETARAAVPAHLRPRTPLTLRATAGLRLLPEGPEAADAILAAARAKLEATEFLVRPDRVTLLDGADEGAFGWIAVNYLLGNDAAMRGAGGGGGGASGGFGFGGRKAAAGGSSAASGASSSSGPGADGPTTSASSSGRGGGKPDGSGVWDWGLKVGVDAPRLQAATFEGLRGLGAGAGRGIRKGEVALRVPADVALQVTNAKRDPGGGCPLAPEFLGADAYAGLRWFGRLAAQLLAVKHGGAGASLGKVDRGPWVAALPAAFDTPLHWSDAELAELQDAALEARVRAQRDEWREMHRSAVARDPGGRFARLPYAEFEWALECVRSRAFSGPYEGSSFSQRRGLLLWVGALVAAYLGLGLGEPLNALNGAVATLVFLIARDTIVSGKLRRYVVCPVVDLANHRSDAGAEVSYEYFSDRFAVEAGADVGAGAQLFISYGDRDNEALLQYYGFVEPSNPHDRYVLPDLMGALPVARDVAEGGLRAAGLDPSVLGDVGVSPAGVSADVVKALEAALGGACSPWDALDAALARAQDAFPTRLEDDESALSAARKLGQASAAQRLALEYRVEKKRLVRKALQGLARRRQQQGQQRGA